jgi:hypothetical protein
MPFAYVAIVEGSDIIVEATMSGTSSMLSSSSIMRAVLPSLPSELIAPHRAKYAHQQCTIFVERGDKGGHIIRYICFIINEPSYGGLHNSAWSLLTEVRRNYERNIFSNSAGASSLSSSTNSLNNESHAIASRRTTLLPTNALPSTDGRNGITVSDFVAATAAAAPTRPTLSSGSGGRTTAPPTSGSGIVPAGSAPARTSSTGGAGHANNPLVRRAVQASESREEVDSHWLLATMNDIQLRYGRVQKQFNKGALSSSVPLHVHHPATSSNSGIPPASSPIDMHVPLLDARLATVSALPTGDDSYNSSEVDDGGSVNAGGNNDGLHNGANPITSSRHAYGSRSYHRHGRRGICGVPCIIASVIILIIAIVYLVLAAACKGVTLPRCR